VSEREKGRKERVIESERKGERERDA